MGDDTLNEYIVYIFVFMNAHVYTSYVIVNNKRERFHKCLY